MWHYNASFSNQPQGGVIKANLWFYRLVLKFISRHLEANLHRSFFKYYLFRFDRRVTQIGTEHDRDWSPIFHFQSQLASKVVCFEQNASNHACSIASALLLHQQGHINIPDLVENYFRSDFYSSTHRDGQRGTVIITEDLFGNITVNHWEMC